MSFFVVESSRGLLNEGGASPCMIIDGHERCDDIVASWPWPLSLSTTFVKFTVCRMYKTIAISGILLRAPIFLESALACLLHFYLCRADWIQGFGGGGLVVHCTFFYTL